MCKVSIALSVYNVVEYVRATIDCILEQSFRDFELLCIDDASTDGTWEVLQEYANNDNRVRLIRQHTNRGLSVSRNIAIAEARGDYLLMIDGDDLFARNVVEKAYHKAQETDADMVIWDYSVFYGDDINSLCINASSLKGITLLDKISLIKRPAFVWTRLLKLDVLRRLGVYFPEGLTKQDIPVHWKLITSLDKIAVIPERLSFYRQQPNSTSNKNDESLFSLALVMDIVGNQLRDDGIYHIYRNEYLRSRLSLLYGMYDHVKADLKEDALVIVKKRLGNDEIEYIHEPGNELSRNARWFYLMLEGNKLAHMKNICYRFIRTIYRKLR